MNPFESCFLLLDNPAGGIENLADMKAAGFAGVFCNVRDYAPPEWEAVVRPRARSLGMFCGPWGRTAKANVSPPTFDPAVLDLLVATADDWDEPLIVNCEKEIDGSGASLTSLIAKKVGKRGAALSVEPIPFDSVDWTPVGHLPVLPQIFPAEQGTSYDLTALKEQWHARGVRCVYFTFGTYAGMKPGDFKLQAPYSLFTGDAIGAGAYALWSPTSSGYEGCEEEPLMEWYEKPYPKGPPVGPDELPRALYPPDAAAKGKTPSLPGDDVLAMKRALKRAQRFATDLDLSQLDDAYHDVFAHGSSPDVKDSGMAGFQLQEGIEGTGWLGDKTYQAIRRALVPTGPNKGKPLLDAEAVRLLESAAQELAAPPEPSKLEAFYSWLDWFVEREPEIHYSMARPIQPLVDEENPPKLPCSLDCSGSLIYISWLAGLPSPDPNGYSGAGYTGSLDDKGAKVDPGKAAETAKSKRVFAFYDSPDHVVCVLPSGKVWGHGQEAGPIIGSSIYYRSGFEQCRAYDN